mgnify:CR=1 FL=1
MKKLLFLLLVFTAISMQAVAACGFESVSVDGCCVTFEVIENGYDYEVNVDGTIYTGSGEHCYSGNGNYALVLTYFKNGVPRCGATHNIQVTDCSVACGFESVTVDDCCVTFEVIENGYDYEVNVDGTIYTGSGEYCYSGNGNYPLVLTYFQNGVPQCGATYNAQITDCSVVCGFENVKVDGCCVKFGVIENGYDYTVEVDGVILTGSGEHCFSDNGSYSLVLTYFDNGVPQCGATHNIEITDCGYPPCDDICRLNPGSIKEHFAPDPCTRLVSSYGSAVHFPCEIVDWNWTAENGTVTELAGGIFAQITFNGSGTHEVCVDVVASDGTQTCVETVCIDVFISEECIRCDVIDDKECNEGARVYQDTEFIQANVYPNPANQYITFDIFTFEETEAQISLINSQGQVIRSYTQQFAADTTQFTINDLSALSEGVYFYHIQMGNHTKTGKISIFK